MKATLLRYIFRDWGYKSFIKQTYLFSVKEFMKIYSNYTRSFHVGYMILVRRLKKLLELAARIFSLNVQIDLKVLFAVQNCFKTQIYC